MQRMRLPTHISRIATLAATLALLLANTGCGGGTDPSPPPPPPPPVQPPSGLSYPTPQSYVVGTAITPLVPAVSGAVADWSVAPALPAGLSISSATGQISGTPAATAAAADYVVRAANTGGAAQFPLNITVQAAPQFWLEPRPGTTIGVAQDLGVSAAFKQRSTDAYPVYADPAAVTWSTSDSTVATVNATGVVHGVAPGRATISGRYQSITSSITVDVGGSMIGYSLLVPGQGVRSYLLFVPSGSLPAQLPLLLSLHGGGGNAAIQGTTSLLSALGQQRKLLVAYLEGTGAIQTWNAGNCCGSAQTQGVDDVAYVRAVLDHIAARHAVDTRRIYASGFSNGGMMSHRLACELSDRISGIAAVGGASAQFQSNGTPYYACNPSRLIPILHVHATNDRNYPYQGGPGIGSTDTDFRSVDASIADWVARNNVAPQFTVENVTATTTCYRYSQPLNPANPSAPVTLCKIDPPDVYDPVAEVVHGGGHSWPGGSRSPAAKSDSPVTDFSVDTYLWSYFGN